MKQDIDTRLGELREAIGSARSMPMSASAVVNREEILELIDRLEGAIDETLSRASNVVDDREAFVASGQSEADDILRAAREQQERLVSDTDVFRVAQERSAEIVERAERVAAETRAEIDAYVEERLANFEITLEKTLEAVKRGRSRLTNGLVGGLADDSDVEDMSLPEHLDRG